MDLPVHCVVLAKSPAAISESPPEEKKLSSTPTYLTRSISAQSCASTSSVWVLGATYAASGSTTTSSAASASRSSLPFGISGNASRATMPSGTR